MNDGQRRLRSLEILEMEAVSCAVVGILYLQARGCGV